MYFANDHLILKVTKLLFLSCCCVLEVSLTKRLKISHVA